MPDFVSVGALCFLFRSRLDEAFGVVVINAGAQVIVAGSYLVALGQRIVPRFLDLIGERVPFLEPGLAAVGLQSSTA